MTDAQRAPCRHRAVAGIGGSGSKMQFWIPTGSLETTRGSILAGLNSWIEPASQTVVSALQPSTTLMTPSSLQFFCNGLRCAHSTVHSPSHASTQVVNLLSARGAAADAAATGAPPRGSPAPPLHFLACDSVIAGAAAPTGSVASLHNMWSCKGHTRIMTDQESAAFLPLVLPHHHSQSRVHFRRLQLCVAAVSPPT